MAFSRSCLSKAFEQPPRGTPATPRRTPWDLSLESHGSRVKVEMRASNWLNPSHMLMPCLPGGAERKDPSFSLWVRPMASNPTGESLKGRAGLDGGEPKIEPNSSTAWKLLSTYISLNCFLLYELSNTRHIIWSHGGLPLVLIPDYDWIPLSCLAPRSPCPEARVFTLGALPV